MTYRGHVSNGVIIADVPTELPDGARVEIRLLHAPPGKHHPDVEKYAGILPPTTDALEDYQAHLREKHS